MGILSSIGWPLAVLGWSWRIFGAPGAVLAGPGPVLGCLGVLFGPSWALLGWSWEAPGAVLGGSWGDFGRSKIDQKIVPKIDPKSSRIATEKNRSGATPVDVSELDQR